VHLPTIYLVSGLFSIFIGPLVGRASDAYGKFPIFAFGSVMSIVMVLIYTHLGQVSLTVAILVNVLMFVGIFSRMIPSQALISAIPEPAQRGSFSAVGASLQQLSGGLGSVLAAALIAQDADGSLRHFDAGIRRRYNGGDFPDRDVFCAEADRGPGWQTRCLRRRFRRLDRCQSGDRALKHVR